MDEDGLYIIARWTDEDSNTITIQDFYKDDGRHFIAVWSDERHFLEENRGNQFEREGVWIKRTLLKEMLTGDELLILNPGSTNPIELRKGDL